tara:strand:+ start:772 stop:984 length:213 start_codon:yes stop_codon:yes gene_type:complete
MKLLIVLTILICLVGCGHRMTIADIEQAQKVCAINGGLKQVYKYNADFYEAYCANGAVFDLEIDRNLRGV